MMIAVQEQAPDSTDSSDDDMSVSTESSILLEPGSPSPPPTLHPLIPISIKMETGDTDETKGTARRHYMTLYVL